MKFFSESGQDAFLLENFFRGRRGGVFVEVGAYDGETASNSVFFERYLGWRGLCVEPHSVAFAALSARRKCFCEAVCVADFDGEATYLQMDGSDAQRMLSGLESPSASRPRDGQRLGAGVSVARQMQVRKLSSLLEKHALFEIDYLSVDACGSELGILSELDFARFEIKTISVDNGADEAGIARLMAQRGYQLVARLPHDRIFMRPGVKRLPRTSVICAVWHGDPERERLLAGHAANLARQTVPVEPIYVFDGRDVPPAALPGRKVVAHEDLSIYQAWNLGLSLVETPLVMNLNLDDRLAPDAVERLQDALLREGAALAGGDWQICYSQETTDAVQPCFPAQRLPFVGEWPPRSGTVTRLGSGTGERGTLGPATLWRMDVHLGAPRYTWRLAEGTVIRSAGDSGWWMLLAGHLGKKIVRVPEIIGNYYSHPGSQAEFRGPPDELELIRSLGVSLL
jgi:FkbM family methyltransferase